MLNEGDLGDDPMPEVERWFAEAQAAGLADPGAMQVATVADGQPTCRTVLLRRLDARGFVFFTNLASTKSRQLAANPACALVLAWPAIHKQVCVTGRAERVGDGDVSDYWQSRPRGSRIGAWASPQSEVLADRAMLDGLVAAVEDRFAGTDDIPVPPLWGGWRVVPETVELWCGQIDRLHDRFRWRRADAGWVRERLAP